MTRLQISMSRVRRREAIDGYLFIMPWLIGFVLWTVGLMIASIILAFMRWDLFGDPVWIGLANFTKLFEDKLVRISLWNTAYYTFISVPLTLTSALGMALLLDQRIHFLAWFRTFFYLPSVMPAVANAVLWMWILNPEVGLV